MGTLPQIAQLAKRTGLTKRTVKNLLRKGWTYNEHHGQVPYWQHPMGNMKIKE